VRWACWALDDSRLLSTQVGISDPVSTWFGSPRDGVCGLRGSPSST